MALFGTVAFDALGAEGDRLLGGLGVEVGRAADGGGVVEPEVGVLVGLVEAGEADFNQRPLAVEVTLVLEDYGEICRLIEVPG